jgi:hypothetical protein
MTCKRVKNSAMNFSWQNTNTFGTHTTFPAFHRSTPYPVSLEIPAPGSFASFAGEKNRLRFLWSPPSHFLRPEDPQDPRSSLCRPAHLPGSGNPPSFLSRVRESETGEAGLVGRLSFLHQAVCLLRRAPLPGFEYSGCGQRVSPGLAEGQGLGDAVYAGGAAANGHPRAEDHWPGRGFGSQRT